MSLANLPASVSSFAIAPRLSCSIARTGLFHLILRTDARLIHSLAAGLRGLLAAGFKILENLLARFAQALFVVGGASLGCGDVGARFFHGALSPASALGEHCGQRPIHEEGIKKIEDRQQNDRRHGSEQ